MPKLSGVVWYDVKDITGAFRVPRSGTAAAAFKAFRSRRMQIAIRSHESLVEGE